jgi:hypothetical protein
MPTTRWITRTSSLTYTRGTVINDTSFPHAAFSYAPAPFLSAEIYGDSSTVFFLPLGDLANPRFINFSSLFPGGEYYSQTGSVLVTDVYIDGVLVPGPIAGAGLSGLILAMALLAWGRRRKKTA